MPRWVGDTSRQGRRSSGRACVAPRVGLRREHGAVPLGADFRSEPIVAAFRELRTLALDRCGRVALHAPGTHFDAHRDATDRHTHAHEVPVNVGHHDTLHQGDVGLVENLHHVIHDETRPDRDHQL